jgi:putative FmdB family regulatory protein
MTRIKSGRDHALPIYEYECQGCHRRLSFLVRSTAHAASLKCTRCGSADLSRLMSRFATIKSEDARLDSLAADAQFGDVDENDPKSMARFMKKMGQEMGEDLGDDVEAAMEDAMGEGDGDGEESLSDAGGADED